MRDHKTQNTYFFFGLLARCVSADAAAVFAALLDRGLRSTFEAAVPAFLPVVSFLFLAIIGSKFENRLA